MNQKQFDPAAFEAALTSATVGRRLVYRQTVDSTMVLARAEAGEGAAHGTLVLAEEQTAGRGRRGRGFHSPPAENLYFTLILRLPADVHRRLPSVIPLAVCAAVRAEGADARIKWPNDIWCGERKLSGMLIDAELTADGAIAYPGVGINVNGDPTTIPELRDIATSLRRELGHPVPRERLLARVCNEIEATLSLPPVQLANAYRGLSMVLGRRVTVQPANGEPFEGLAEAIEDDGSLVVVRANGRRESVNAADVSVRPAPGSGTDGT